MLINIFCFFCFYFIGFIANQHQLTLIGVMYHKSLKMRKLHK